jgi:hypothetical protein
MKKIRSISSNLYKIEELSTIIGGEGTKPPVTNNQSSESGDDECSSSLNNQDVPDCYDAYTYPNRDEELTTEKWDSCGL